MNKIDRLRMRHELAVLLIVTVLILALAACQPIVDPALLEAQGTMSAEVTTEAEVAPTATAEPAAETAEATPIPGLEPAQATVNTRSLRVRGEPNEASEVVTGVREGETYDVLGISSDGIWIHLAIPRAPEGTGWVSAEFVTLEGDITNIDIVEVGDGSEDSAPVAEEAETPVEASEEAVEEVTDETDSEAAEEESAAEESATAESETTEAADDESATAAEDMAEEGDEVTEEAPTDTEPAEEASQAASPDAGYVLINTGGTPLRVRSEPTTEVDNKVGNVFDGEIYQVLEISEDGEWVRIAVPQLDLEDGGWVSAEFVVMGE